MSERFNYRIEGFFPSDTALGSYGFAVELDKDLATKALNTEIPEAGYVNLQTMAREMITRVGLAKKGEQIREPLKFVTNNQGKTSCLLQFCDVPGNACDLGIDGITAGDFAQKGVVERNPVYNPHNVDHPRQAYALLSAWLTWSDCVEAFLSD